MTYFLGLAKYVEGFGVPRAVKNLVESLLENGSFHEWPTGVFLVTKDDVI
jgi:hypothetical protein